MAITPIGVPGASAPALPAPKTQPQGGQPFADALSALVENVKASGAGANDAVARMLDGSGDVHDAMIALQRADTTFQLAMQVRNKLVQAYQDIMRMPV
jgi:flagellar hook-basal body complex protein FliE